MKSIYQKPIIIYWHAEELNAIEAKMSHGAGSRPPGSDAENAIRYNNITSLTIDQTKWYRQDVVLEKVDGNIVLVRENGDAAAFNEAAGMILEKLIDGQEKERILKELSEVFDADPGVIRDDYEELLVELYEKELIMDV